MISDHLKEGLNKRRPSLVYGGTEDIVQVVSGLALAAVWRAGIGRDPLPVSECTTESQAPPAAVSRCPQRENPCTHFREDTQLPAVYL